MLRPKVTTLPGHIQAVYVQNMVKLYASILQQKEQAGEKEAAQEITQLMIERLPQFVQSADLEVQERVREQNEAIQGTQLEEGGGASLPPQLQQSVHLPSADFLWSVRGGFSDTKTRKFYYRF